jgi:hypothetical protein
MTEPAPGDNVADELMARYYAPAVVAVAGQVAAEWTAEGRDFTPDTSEAELWEEVGRRMESGPDLSERDRQGLDWIARAQERVDEEGGGAGSP